MATKSLARRDPVSGRLLAGHGALNPSGRPKGFAGLAKAIREETDGYQELMDFALATFRDTSHSHANRWAAMCWLTDRGVGRPVTTIDLQAIISNDGDAQSEVDFSSMTTAQLAAALAKLDDFAEAFDEEIIEAEIVE